MSIVGQEISPFLARQITKKQEVYGSLTHTSADLNYLHNRNAWIKVGSSLSINQERLDLLNDYDGPQLDNSNLGRGLARNFVLFNGVSQYNPITKTQNNSGASGNVSSTSEKGGNLLPLPTNIGQGWNTVYGFGGTEFGIDPMPGIESLDIKYLNRGSIKEFNLKIKCFNRNQFNIIDNLYLRLGFNLLIEFGWNQYLNPNTGTYEKMPKTILENGWFNQDANLTNIKRQINATRNNTYYHYDASIARVTNFEWNFENDGSYDISVKLLSQGDVIESLRANVSPPPTIINFIKDTNSKRNGGEEQSNSVKVDNLMASIDTSVRIIAASISERLYDPFLSSKDINVDGFFSFRDSDRMYFLPSIVKDAEVWQFKANPDSDEPGDDQPRGYKNAYKWTNSSHLLKASNLEENLVARSFYQEFTDYDNISGLWNYCTNNKNIIDDISHPSLQVTKDVYKQLKKLGLIYGETNYYEGSVEDLWDDEDPNDIEGYVLYDPQLTTLKLEDLSQYLAFDKKDCFYLKTYSGEDEDLSFYVKFKWLTKWLASKIIPNRKEKNSNDLTALFSINPQTTIYSVPNHISHDIRICIVGGKYIDPRSDKTVNIFENILSKKRNFIKVGDKIQYTKNLEDIYLNTKFLAECMSSTDEEGNISIYNFFKNICNGINRALGGINNIEPVFDEENSTLAFIENTKIPGKYIPPVVSYQIEIYGYDNKTVTIDGMPKEKSYSGFVTKAGIKTTISKEYASMITIGATAKGFVKGVEASAFSKWNRGCEDVFAEEYTNTYESGSEAESPILNVLNNVYPDLSRLDLFVENKLAEFVLGSEINGNSEVNLNNDIIDNNLSLMKDYYIQLHGENAAASSPDELTPSTVGFLPFNLNLEMDGISGFVIYNLIRINTKFLPSNYPKAMDFIIKGVSHNLSNNNWSTKIDTIATPNVRHSPK